MTPDGQGELKFDTLLQPLARPSREHVNYGMQEGSTNEVSSIPGLYYFPEFLDCESQQQVVRRIDDGNHWRDDLERRVQHYGWRYDYRTRTIAPSMYLGPLPGWLAVIAVRLHRETALFDRVPDQAIVNEYEPGQGIALHADRQCFGAAVATISLEDDWEMKLRPVTGGANDDRRIMLVRGSALVMTGTARYRWLHGIEKRKTEKNEDGSRRERRRRLSLTFRTVLDQSSASRPTDTHPVAA